MAYKQPTYMDHTQPDAFVDWVHKEPAYGCTKECPRCKGFGGWNLLLNSYPLHGKEDTPENRHLFSHFRAMCSHCNGWGYVSPDETCPGHEWVWEANTGRCLNLYRCTVCGKKSEVDSGD